MTPRPLHRWASRFVALLLAVGCADLEHWEDVRVSVSGPTELEVGQKVALVAETANGIMERYRWESHDQPVLTVDEYGRATGRRAGQATITARGAKSRQTGSLRLTVVAPDAPGAPDAGSPHDAGRDAGVDAGARDAAPPEDDADASDEDAGALDASRDAGTQDAASAPSFADDVHPILRTRCGACHAPGGFAADTNFVLVDAATTDRETVLDLIDTVDPDQSRLLAKGRGDLTHGGGIVLARTSADYATLRAWIDAGAPP
jgi:hypothetical protein